MIHFYECFDEAKNKKHLYKALAIAYSNSDIQLWELEKIIQINTIVQYEDEYYALRQDAYIDGAKDNPYFTACAICLSGDEIGETCNVYWDIKLDEESFKNCDDLSDMCDWDEPANVRF